MKFLHVLYVFMIYVKFMLFLCFFVCSSVEVPDIPTTQITRLSCGVNLQGEQVRNSYLFNKIVYS